MKTAQAEGRKANHYVYTGASQDELTAVLDPEWPGPLPHTILVATNGKIVYRHNGKIDPKELRAVIIKELTPYWPNP